MIAALWPALQPIIAAIMQAVLPFLWEKLNAPNTAEIAGRNSALDQLWTDGLHGNKTSGSVSGR